MPATQQQTVRRPLREAWRDSIPGVHLATNREGQRLFDYQARQELGISGAEFLKRWDRGDYQQVPDPERARKVRRMELLIPVVRRTRT